MTRARAAWAAILAPLWLVLALCCAWEPVVRDGWGHVRWHRWTGLSLGSLRHAIVGGYTSGNPRLGQIVTILLYTPGPWHVLVAPLLELAIFALLTTLVLGRWPSLRRTDDAAVFVTVTALVLVCVPIVGQMLFYRPYTGNYLFGFAMQLAFLVPYRLRAEGGPAAAGGAWWRAVAMLWLGVAAGMCNEHTPPAIGAAALVAVLGCGRRAERPRAWPPAWMIAGLVGIALGWLALIYAPGQALRYNALAQQATTLERIRDRGAGGDATIVLHTLWYLGWAAPWLVLGAVAWWRAGAPAVSSARRWVVAVGLGAAVLAAVTLLGSPKEGERLAFAACALAAAAIAAWVTAQVAPGWSRRACVALAVVALALVLGKCVLVMHRLDGEFTARMAAIEGAPKDSTVTVAPYSVPRSRWFLGDDFAAPATRQFVADTFGLAHLELAPAMVAP